MFDRKYWKTTHFENEIISVGNLSVGGTGKTPLVCYLIEQNIEKKRIAVLSRGYGRKTKGIVIADEFATTKSIGDEAYFLYQKYGDRIIVAVAEKRTEGVEALNQYIQPDLIVLDDAFQHRWIHRNQNILLTDFENLFTEDYILPLGKLRENRKSAKRATQIIITKCPPKIPKAKQERIKESVKQYSSANVSFSFISYSKLVQVSGKEINNPKYIIGVCGIAKPLYFKNYLNSSYELLDFVVYKDHHDYTLKDIEVIKSKMKTYQRETVLVVTEKDWVKLKKFQVNMKGIHVFVLPIRLTFL